MCQSERGRKERRDGFESDKREKKGEIKKNVGAKRETEESKVRRLGENKCEGAIAFIFFIFTNSIPCQIPCL
jgi:hypothetical protein